MRSEFWLTVWENGNLGFHLDQTNPFLMKFWSQMGLEAGDPVFVPLCGKTLDMVWLAEQKHPVMGVELSPIAAEDFFTENNIEATLSADNKFSVWHGGDIEIKVGNFFDITADDLKDTKAVYDRASIVALPPTMRQDYAKHLNKILTIDTKILMLTFEYDQDIVEGPPHSVTHTEIRHLFESNFLINKLDSRDLIERAKGMQAAGLKSFVQHTFLLEKIM
ncbi:MAG: thiopurine S-methyltransferase [Chloroflexota bacterium]